MITLDDVIGQVQESIEVHERGGTRRSLGRFSRLFLLSFIKCGLRLILGPRIHVS